MSAELDRCREATVASLEVVLEECEGRDGHVDELGENAFAFVPEGALPPELHDVDAEDEEAFEDAVLACMGTDYAHDLVESILGDDMGRRNRKHVRRSICERLLR